MTWLTVLGIPAGVYVASITAVLFLVQTQKVDPWAVAGSGLLAIGAYIFHRTYAKRTSHMQLRHRIALQHRGGLYIAAAIVSIAAATVLFQLNSLAPLLLIGTFFGIVLYGRNVLGSPIRSHMAVKPLAVGVSIAILAWVVAGMQPNWIPTATIAIICSADALLCDLDDRTYDESTHCFTLAAHLGSRWTWVLAATMYVIASAGMIFSHLHTTIGWAFLIMFPMPILFQKFGLRTAIDLRPLLVLLLAWII